MAGSDEDFEMILVANGKLGEKNQQLNELVADYGQRLRKDNELLLEQQEKIEELQNRGNELLSQRLELKKEIEDLQTKKNFWKGKFADMGETALSIENKWLKQQLKALGDATTDLLESIIWICDHKPDNIQIPAEIQAKCQKLQQTITEKGE